MEEWSASEWSASNAEVWRWRIDEGSSYDSWSRRHGSEESVDSLKFVIVVGSVNDVSAKKSWADVVDSLESSSLDWLESNWRKSETSRCIVKTVVLSWISSVSGAGHVESWSELSVRSSDLDQSKVLVEERSFLSGDWVLDADGEVAAAWSEVRLSEDACKSVNEGWVAGRCEESADGASGVLVGACSSGGNYGVIWLALDSSGDCSKSCSIDNGVEVSDNSETSSEGW